MNDDKIQILSLDLLNILKDEVALVERMKRRFGFALGWHYMLDIAWALRELKDLAPGSLVLDAGAGSGLMQFLLAELGYNVISTDFANRAFSRRLMWRYKPVIHQLSNQNATIDNDYTRHLEKTYGVAVGQGGPVGITTNERLLAKERATIAAFIEKNRMRPDPAAHQVAPDVLKRDPIKNCGRIFIYKSDLKNLALLEDTSVDAVVSVSALEHNGHEDFRKCTDEITRVAKPGAKIIATVGASLEGDWFHEPSKGWCYSEETLKKLFLLKPDAQSNYDERGAIFEGLRKENNVLHKNLSRFYFKSESNGMPFGKWDPKYLPVGVMKTRPASRLLEFSYATVPELYKMFDANPDWVRLTQLKFYQYQWTLDHALSIFKRLDNVKVLSIGEGFSTLANRMATLHGAVVTVLDSFEDEWKTRKDKTVDDLKAERPAVRYLNGLAGEPQKHGIPDESFDCVYSNSVLEHVPRQRLGEILADADRMLKPGGLHLHTIDVPVDRDDKFALYVSAFKKLAHREDFGLFDRITIAAIRSNPMTFYESPEVIKLHWFKAMDRKDVPYERWTSINFMLKKS